MKARNWKRFKVTAICLAAVFALMGCSGNDQPKAPEPPVKPLSTAETAMIERIEAMPPSGRQDFARSNFQALMQMSRENKAFADRINALLGDQQSNEKK